MQGLRAAVVDRMWRMISLCSKKPVLATRSVVVDARDKHRMARIERYAGRKIYVMAFYAHELEDRPVTIRPLRAACFHGSVNTIHGADWVLQI